MFTQLFGYYLLNNNIITAEQLRAALEVKNNTHAKLGAMAIDAGFMTAAQVDTVHEEQKRVDKRIGDIAVQLGFLREQQVEMLLAQQKTANVVLGQALIDLGYLSNKQFEDALKDYKSSATFTGEQTDEALAADLAKILDIENDKDKEFYTDYVLLLNKNLIRFIGDDFVIAGCTKNSSISCKHLSRQDLTDEEGKVVALTAVSADDSGFISIASRYAIDSSDEEDSGIDEFGLFNEVDEFVEACVGEFLNLQNGLFAVNISNKKCVELDLTPQIAESNTTVEITNGIALTLEFTFGKVDFIISKL